MFIKPHPVLDRYVLWSFLKNYAISLIVLIGLYVVMDMVFNFDQVVHFKSDTAESPIGNMLTVVHGVVDYYFYQSFLIFVTMSGIIPVVAAAFTLMRLSRFGELTALLAAGVPLLRVSAPIIVAAAVLNVLLVADQELLLPTMIPKLVRKHDEIFTPRDAAFELHGMEDDRGSVLLAARVHPTPTGEGTWLQEMDLLDRNPADLRPSGHTLAERADWDPVRHLWKLTKGRKITGLLPGETLSAEQPVETYQSSITPDEIALNRSSAFVELLPTRKLDELIARPKAYGRDILFKVKYMRFTQPLMNVILLLLAIPTVLTHDPKELKRAASKCLTLTGLAMGSVFVAQQIAGTPPPGNTWVAGWPALMAWIPIFIYGPLSVFLMDRVAT